VTVLECAHHLAGQALSGGLDIGSREREREGERERAAEEKTCREKYRCTFDRNVEAESIRQRDGSRLLPVMYGGSCGLV